jgi:hypothetical protein
MKTRGMGAPLCHPTAMAVKKTATAVKWMRWPCRTTAIAA